MSYEKTGGQTEATHQGRTAAVLVIGNELLSGRVREANVQYLATRLKERGVAICEARVIRDDLETIASTLNLLRGQYDYVFTTGGIGPTHDDITAEAVAKAFDIDLLVNDEAFQLLNDFYGASEFSPARQRMARIPACGKLLYNPVSIAPGFQVENVFVLPGVPKIMQAIVDGFIAEIGGGDPLEAITVTVLLGESLAAPYLEACQEQYPEIEMGSYPFLRPGGFGVSMVLRGRDRLRLQSAASDLEQRLVALGTTIRREDGEAEAPESMLPENALPKHTKG